MKQIRFTRNLLLACGVAVLAAVAVAAQSPVVAPTVGPAQIEWASATTDALELTVSGPEGFYLRQTFAAGLAATFSIFDEDGNLRPGGAYAFEVKAVPVLDEQTREDLAAVRDQGGDGALAKSNKIPAPRITSGYFSIVDGAIEMGNREEDGQAPAGGNRLATKATVLTNGDGVIRNSLCVGFDCPNSPTFSDSTILLMENNTRIKFGDTSNSPFPNNDWEIEANSSLSGGQSYLGFNDCGTADNDGGCVTDLVFAVEAGARQNALYVESDGDVGMGTSNPVVNIHTVDGNTPTLRLEQDGSSGFAPQTWDVAGNETNFFIRDVTGGSTLPFRIRPGAPTSSIDIAGSGDVGIGTASPQDELHVDVAGGNGGVLIESDSNLPQLTINNAAVASSDGQWRFRVNSVGNFVFTHADTDSTSPFVIEPEANTNLLVLSGGEVQITGAVRVNGTQVHPDYVFEPDYALESIEEHSEYMWAKKHLPAIGAGTYQADGRSTVDLVGHQFGIVEELEKAHIYIEQLNSQLKEKDAHLAQLQEEVGALKEAVQALQERE